MSDVRRALVWFLVVVLCTVIAVIVTAEPGTPLDRDPSLVTTPSTTEPVIAHIEETP